MHWFDRMSKQFAEAPPTATRRSMLRGTAVAVAVAPFAPGALAYANRQLKRRDSTEDCINCLSRSAGRTAAAVARCKAETPKAETASARHLLLKPKGGGAGKGSKGGKGGKAKKKGMKPTEAAKRAACMGRAAERFLEESDNCTKVECAGLGETAPRPVGPGTGGGSGCPVGTKPCSGLLCCYGEDNCCPCGSIEGGFICCAAVIQCACC